MFSFTYDLVAIVWPDFQLPDLFISLAVIHGVPARLMKQIECLCELLETSPIGSIQLALCSEPCLIEACSTDQVMPIFVFALLRFPCPALAITRQLSLNPL